MDRKALPLVGRSQSYLVLVGVVVGMMVAGLLVPLAFGESVSGGDETATSDFELPEGDAGTTDTTLGGAVDPTTGDTLVSGGVAAGGAAAPGAPGAPGDPGAAASAPIGGGPAPGQPGSAGRLTASDRGVTPTTIRVGAVLLDIATVGRLGVGVAIDPEQQQAAFQAFADEINSRGGINGRKLEMHYRAFDVTDRNDQIAACRELTQEKQVFVVLAGFNTVDPNVCIVEENKTPLLSSAANNPDWLYARSGGRLLTLFPRSGRMMSALVAELERVKLAGKRIGILSDGLNDPGGQVATQLEKLLEARGHKVSYRGQLSDDISTASSQTPVEVNRMQTTNGGAEVVVFLNSNAVYGTQFVNQADSQNYHPTYVNTDWASNNGDSTNQNMPRSYEGAISFTFSRGMSSKRGLPPTAESQRCRAIYDKHSGRKLKEPNTNEHGLTMSYCDDMRLFELLATRAGPNLTRMGFVNARSVIGPFVPANWSPGSFAANKPDLADGVRTQRWVYECKCWTPVDAFHRPGG